MDIKLIKTDTSNLDFQTLVKLLDYDLALRNGDMNAFFVEYNTMNYLQHVIVAYINHQAVGCGALKPFSVNKMEIKRMYVEPKWRGKGVSVAIVQALEQWTDELGYRYCVLETGLKMPEAIGLYRKCGFYSIPNYPPYEHIKESMCFEKRVGKNENVNPNELN